MSNVPASILRPVGVRPALRAYLGDAWARRGFWRELTRARVSASTHGTLLGPVWLLLTPVLTAVLYYVVFGILLGARNTVPDYPLFLLTGVLLFTFISRALSAATTSLSRQRDLVRAIPFPRILLTVSAVGVEVAYLRWSLLVLVGTAAVSVGVHVTWLLVPVAVALLVALTTGLGLLLARATASFPDTAGLLPFGLRAAAYLSGAYFPLSVAAGAAPVLAGLLECNPLAAALTLTRELLSGQWPATSLWLLVGVPAVAVLVAGVVAFWHGEPRYGRD